MSRFMEFKSNNRDKTKRSSKKFEFSDSTFERYRNEINMATTFDRKSTIRKKMSSQEPSKN